MEPETGDELDTETARMEAMKTEVLARLDSLRDMMQKLQSMSPDRPWLAMSESEASARRTIDSLRGGMIRSADPEEDPDEMADAMEGRLEYLQLILTAATELCDLHEIVQRERLHNEKRMAELLRIVDDAERAMPAARIADAEERKRARRLHRARRGTVSRPRGGGTGGRKK